MKLCVISSKKCWQENGLWMAGGGFPLQMSAIASLFDDVTLVVTRGVPEKGGSPLPSRSRIVALRRPPGANLRRKLAVLASSPYYMGSMIRECVDADVIHTPLPGDIPLLGFIVGLLMRKRLIGRYGGSWSATRATTLADKMTKTLMTWIAGGRNVMLATGEGQAPPASGMHWLFVSCLSQEDIERSSANKRSSRPGDPADLVYLGRLSEEKGVTDLIKGFALFAKKRSTAPAGRLTLIGSGPMEKRLRDLACNQGVAELTEFCGQLSHADALKRLERADICLLPSHTESFCKARLDAFACGVPVVTTEVGFGRQIVGSNGERGWIVRDGAPDDISDKIEVALVGPNDWGALRERCRAFVRGRTLEAWADNIRAICADQWGVFVQDGRLR